MVSRKVQGFIALAVAAVAAVPIGIGFGVAASAQQSPLDPVPADRSGFMTTDQLEGKVAEAAQSLDGLEYPSASAKRSALDALKRQGFARNTLWEEGIEENIALDGWECSWLQYAEDAYLAGDTEEMAHAGRVILQRADFPGQRDEKFPNIDVYMEHVIQPLIEGEWGPARDELNTSCVAYVDREVAR